MSDGTTINPIYAKELLEQIEALRRKGVDLSALNQQSFADSGKSHNSVDTKDIKVTGSLTILLTPVEKVQGSETWVHIGDLEGEEWVALFKDVLNCPMGNDEPYFAGDNIDERYERVKQNFQQKLKDYRMLSRIWDMYIDVKYEPQEIKELRDECLKVKFLAADNQAALRGLTKLMVACDEATKSKVGIELLSD